ncbi:hypothetical protein LQV63_15000 [Paenibacillus profundus]|uniref:Lantibiotic dehydratase N-terminal domain-containing protein n=1 Tax=Paenibacillus profundus TaxID=1173085 RepID=A0ABS8YHL5_9BACL|nr:MULTISPECIES: hypothetical protein [Paenibacillus]MCE5170622.1 hypothetical protein [Paenibacillus profundus]
MNINPLILVRENSLEKKSIDLSMDNPIYMQIISSRLELAELKDGVVKELDLFYKAEKDIRILDIKRHICKDKIHKINLDTDQFHGNETDPLYLLLSEYASKYKELEQLEHEAENRYNAQLKTFRQSMIELLVDKEDILSGLLMINPDIYYKLNAYINTPLDLHKNKTRKVESTLYKFISRAMLKTSPFLSITNVGRAKMQANPADRTAHHENYTKHVSLNYTLLYRLAFYFFIQSNRFIKTIDFYLPPYSIRQDEGACYISFLSRKDLPENNKLYLPSENLGELKIPANLANLFESKDMDNNLGFEDFMAAFDHRISEENMYQIIRKYISIGLLIPAVGFNEGSSELLLLDIQQTAQKYLNGDDFEKLNRFLADLTEISKKISLHNKYEAKHIIHQELAALLFELEQETGIKFPANSVFYEDGIMDKVQFIHTENVEQSYMDFKKLQAFSLIFDASIRLQYEMGTKLYEHANGQEMEIDSDFFSILFAVSKEMIPYWEDITYTRPDIETEEIRILDHLKTSFIQEFRSLCLSCEQAINIKALIDKYIRQIPERIIKHADITSSYFVQFNEDNIIVNAVYDGHEKFKARFMNYFTPYLLHDDAYTAFSANYYDSQNYYEFTESFGFNGNVKNIKLKKECCTVGIGTKRFLQDAEKPLTHVEDFKIKIKKENKRFRLIDKDKQTVKVCFRGSLVPTSMPGYISVLLQLFSSGSMLFKFSDLLERDVMPRITYGNIVLNRHRIKLSSISEELKRREGENNYHYYRRVNMYFLENNLKQKFFIIAKRDFLLNDPYLRDFKPLYIDISNPIALRILEKEMISKSETEIFHNFYIEEYLSNEGDYAKEYDIEIYKKEGEGIGEQLANL